MRLSALAALPARGSAFALLVGSTVLHVRAASAAAPEVPLPRPGITYRARSARIIVDRALQPGHGKCLSTARCCRRLGSTQHNIHSFLMT